MSRAFGGLSESRFWGLSVAANGNEVQQPLKKMFVLPGMIEQVMDNCPSSRTPRATKEDKMIPAMMNPKRPPESRAPRQHKTDNPSVQKCLGVFGSPSMGKINGTIHLHGITKNAIVDDDQKCHCNPRAPHSMLWVARNRLRGWVNWDK